MNLCCKYCFCVFYVLKEGMKIFAYQLTLTPFFFIIIITVDGNL